MAVTVHTRGDITAKRGRVAGAAELVTKAAADRASCERQCSSDPDVWTNAPVALLSKTVTVGLAVSTSHSFRVLRMRTAGEGNGSQVISLLVG